MKTYLVTGGAGFIGSNFIVYMLNKYRNIRIINLDKLTYAGNLENLKCIEANSNYEFIQGDICDKVITQLIFDNNDVDYIINFAAESHVDRSIKEPEIFYLTNVLGTVNLLNTAKKNWENNIIYNNQKKFVQISTDEVYGTLGNTGLFTESTPLDPHSPYSASKASADMIVKAYYDTYNIPINITRCSNNYGYYQFPEKLIPLIINNCINGNPIPVYGDGQNIRDWLFVEDHCTGIDKVINQGIVGQTYNIGGNNEKQNIEIVKIIITIINDILCDNKGKAKLSEELIKYVEDRKGHDRRYAIDSSKIKSELNWKPETTFEQGIVKTVRWYLENNKWLESVTSGEYQKYYKDTYKK